MLRGVMIRGGMTVTCNVSLGLAWTTHYPGPWAWFRNLDAAYRGPTLFCHRLLLTGSTVNFVSCDEKVDAPLLDGVLGDQEAPVAFYLAGHGSFGSTGPETILDHDRWSVIAKPVGCSMIVMETCSLVDTRVQWERAFASASFGTELRVILGFDGAVALSRGTALRGFAFADLLTQGMPIVEAWQRAVAQTSSSSFPDHPVALVLGDDESDAYAFASNATVNDIPKPRLTTTPYLHLVGP